MHLTIKISIRGVEADQTRIVSYRIIEVAILNYKLTWVADQKSNRDEVVTEEHYV